MRTVLLEEEQSHLLPHIHMGIFFHPPKGATAKTFLRTSPSKNYPLCYINLGIGTSCKPVVSICQPLVHMEIIEVHAIPRLTVVSIVSIILLLVLLWFARNWYGENAHE